MSTETVKKTKATAKPKTAAKTQAGEAEGAVKAESTVVAKKKAAPKTKAAEVAATHTPSYEQIAQLAEQYWAERGWQDGYAEQDWLRAERELGAAS
jgi:hypothetical protein